MYETKTWEEATKLKKSEKIRITLYILNAILDILTGIIGKNIAWVICGILWIVIVMTEVCYLKMKKGNEEIITLQENHTELQAIIIDALLNESSVEVDISKIKIPKNFSKPNQKKMQRKYWRIWGRILILYVGFLITCFWRNIFATVWNFVKSLSASRFLLITALQERKSCLSKICMGKI